MPFPLALESLIGKPLLFVLLGVIGFAFGFVLEISGFGNSRKLAAQFYFKELTVLKVMFTAIVVAMVLIFTTVGLGWLDFNNVWVNPHLSVAGYYRRLDYGRRLYHWPLLGHLAGGSSNA